MNHPERFTILQTFPCSSSSFFFWKVTMLLIRTKHFTKDCHKTGKTGPPIPHPTLLNDSENKKHYKALFTTSEIITRQPAPWCHTTKYATPPAWQKDNGLTKLGTFLCIEFKSFLENKGSSNLSKKIKHLLVAAPLVEED